mmetsp:Transcript_17444/g.36806  ORF Transcript_17444/g.36806 Transcript_17444/m.36806 type:complete len:348 (-) Transcript_17444:1521-2564(-)
MRDRESVVRSDPADGAGENRPLPEDRSRLPNPVWGDFLPEPPRLPLARLPPVADAAAICCCAAFLRNRFFCRKIRSNSLPRGNTSRPMRTTASPPGSMPYLSRKRDRSLALGGRPNWKTDWGLGPSYTSVGEGARPLLPSPEDVVAEEEEGCCFRENMRFTMLFFFVFPVRGVPSLLFLLSLSVVTAPARPSAVSSIKGIDVPGKDPIKFPRLLSGRSTCFRLPSNVSLPFMTRSAKPTGMAKVGCGGVAPPSSFNFDVDSPKSSNIRLPSSSRGGSKLGTNPNVTQNDLGAKFVEGTGVLRPPCPSWADDGRNSASNANELVRLTNLCCGFCCELFFCPFFCCCCC